MQQEKISESELQAVLDETDQNKATIENYAVTENFPLNQQTHDDTLINIFEPDGLQQIDIKSNQVTPLEAVKPVTAEIKPPYNIYDGLNHLDQIKMKHELATTTITPFDKVEYIQVLENPFRQSHYITVQLFKPTLRPSTPDVLNTSRSNAEKAKASNYQPMCLKDHYVSEILLKPNYLYCDYCETSIEERCYTCGQCDYHICQKCNLKYYRRKNLIEQTSNHIYFSNHVLKAVSEENQDEESDEDEGDLEVKKQLTEQEQRAKDSQRKIKRLEELKRKSIKLSTSITKVCNSHPFANVEKSDMNGDQPLPGNKAFKKYVVVGLWKDCKGVFTCFRMFKINNPVFQMLKTKEDPQNYEKSEKEREFFHFVSNNELMYFTNEYVVKGSGDNVIRCNFLDLQQATIGANLVPENEQLFKPPLLRQYVFEQGTQINQLLSKILIEKSDRIICQANFQTLMINGVQMFAVTAETAWAKDTAKWIDSPYTDGYMKKNLLFFDLKSQQLKFTIFNADLLLQVTQKNPVTLYVLRRTQIVELVWNADVLTTQQTQEYLSEYQPYQSILRYFNFVPRPDRSNFIGLQKELNDQLESCQKSGTLIRGAIHKDGSRVSISYLSGGIFTFQLEEKALFSEPSVWQGELGEMKDFEMTNCTIINGEIKAEGEHSSGLGKFKVNGRKVSDTQEWEAYYKQNNEAYQMELQTFHIDVNGKVTGSGSDNVGEFNISGTKDKLSIKWIKRYEKHSIYYSGYINEELTSINGLWGHQEGQYVNENQFWMTLKLVSEIEITVQSLSQDQSSLLLKGTFDQSTAIIEGTFTCSNNLKAAWLIDKNSPEKNVFKLMGHECQNRAVRLLTSTDMDDARFTTFKDPETGLEKFCAIGNLRLPKENINSGYKRATVDLLDLDDKNMISSQIVQNLRLNLPKTFQEVPDEKGVDVIPYHVFMPFKIFDSKKLAFKTQILYQDSILGGRRLCFASVSLQQELKGELEPQCPALMAENYTVNYPILAYKSELPSDQQLVICNLAQNIPQQYINIQPYKFVQFVSTGLDPEKNLSEYQCQNNAIYFLVSLFDEDILDDAKEYKGDSYQLMCYRQFPWPVDKDETEYWYAYYYYQFNPQIQLLTGKIELNKYAKDFKTESLLSDKIVHAAMLQRVQPDGVQVLVVLQLVNEIVCFFLMRERVQRLQDHRDKMLKLQMIRGHSEQIYFAEEDQTGVQKMILLTFTDKDRATKTPIYQSDSAKILAFNVVYNEDLQPYVYVLDSDKCIRRLRNKANIESDFQIDLVLNVSHNPGMQKLQSSLQKSYWQNILFSEKVIISVQHEKTESVAQIMSVKSELNVNMDFIGFQYDRKYVMKKQERYNYSEIPNAVLTLYSVPFCGMNLFQIQEGKNNFFMIQNVLGSRKIDLMRYDTQKSLRESITLIGNSFIAVKLQNVNQQLLYSQETFQFIEAINIKELKRLTPVVEGMQYFSCFYEENYEHKLQKVFRINKNGTRTEIYKDVYDDLQFVENEIFKDCQIEFYKNDLVMHACDENLLGAVGWSYREVSFGLSLQQESFMKGWIDIQVLMIKDIKQLRTQNEQIAQMSALGRSTKRLMTSVSNSFKTLVGSSDSSQELSPTAFVIQCANWEKLEGLSKVVIFTRDYLVIKHGLHVCFAKKELIYRTNQFAFQAPSAAKLKDLLKQGRCSINFKLINFAQVSSNFTKRDLKICEVQPYDLALSEKGEKRFNVIQISMNKLAIMWDLDEDKEVTFFSNPRDFTSIDNYLPTGFVPFDDDSEQLGLNEVEFYTQNENRSLLLTNNLWFRPTQLFRTYSFINLLDVLYLKEQVKDNQEVSMLDLDTMFQNFQGLSFFQIFRSNEDFFTYLEVKAKEMMTKTANESGRNAGSLLVRKIYRTFNLPVIKEDMSESVFQALEGPSLLQATMFDEENLLILNNYLKLLKLSDEYRLSDLVANFQCFEQVFKIQSNQIQDFLQEAHFENSESKSCKTLKWNPAHQMITFGSNYSLLSKDEIAAEVREQQLKKLSILSKIKRYFRPQRDYLKDKLKTFSVKVRILEIEWVADNLLDFYYYLNGISDNQMFGNEFIKILLEQQYYTNQLLFKVFLPYLTNMVLTLIYLSYFLPTVPVVGGFFGTEEYRTQAVLRCLIVLGDLFFIGVEVRQLLRIGRDYFSDSWNIVFWTSNILILFIVLEHGTQSLETDLNTLIQLGSVQIVIQWAILYYWMRLFPELAFYVTMISETISDIKNFLVMFLMCIGMFANAAYTLNLIVPDPEAIDSTDLEPLWSEAFGVPFIDSFFNQYQIGLGNGDTSTYGASPAAVLIFIYYILATIFTQIMFFNMLIAIMSETFARVSEAKERSALMERTHLYADFMWGIRLSKELQGMRYLYVIRPNNDESSEASTLELLQKRVTDLMQEQNVQNMSEIASLQSKVQLILQNHYQNKQELNAQIESIKHQQNQMRTEIDQKLNQIISRLK